MNKGFAVAGSFLGNVLDLGVKLLAVGVILQIIFGAAVPFIGLDILANLIKFITALEPRLSWIGCNWSFSLGI